jgi:enoyl-CoA hydratase/carnithine racemase
MEGALVEGHWPAWFVASRQRGWEAFQKFPAPGAKDEMWRFSNVKALALDGFRYPGAVADAKTLVADVAGLEIDAGLSRMTAAQIANRRASVEGQEGVAAFLERRKPGWLN